MKRLVILVAFSFVLAFSAYAEAFKAPDTGRLPPHSRSYCSKVIEQTSVIRHHMDQPWQFGFEQSWNLVLYVSVIAPSTTEVVKVESEDTCIGSSWAKKVAEAPKPVPPPPPPPPKVVPPPPPPPKVVPPPPKPEPPKPVPPPVVEKPKPKPVLDPVPFDINKTNVNPIGAKVLDKNGAVMKEYPNMKVEIGGHTDSTGSEAANKAISEKRATSCKKYLMDKFNISGDRMATKGYGSSKPIGDNKTREGKEKNRRVEFQIISY